MSSSRFSPRSSRSSRRRSWRPSPRRSLTFLTVAMPFFRSSRGRSWRSSRRSPRRSSGTVPAGGQCPRSRLSTPPQSRTHTATRGPFPAPTDRTLPFPECSPSYFSAHCIKNLVYLKLRQETSPSPSPCLSCSSTFISSTSAPTSRAVEEAQVGEPLPHFPRILKF